MIKVNKKFILLTIAAGIAAFYLGGLVSYFIFYSVLLILCFSIFYILLMRKFIIAKVTMHKGLYYAGDCHEITTIIGSRAPIPLPYIMVKSNVYMLNSDKYNGDVVDTSIVENRWIRYNVIFHQRGIYDFGSVFVKITDIFGITSCEKNINNNFKIKVYPKLHEIDNIPLAGKDIYKEIADINSNNEDLSSIKDLRKYRYGDSIKKIHWKASAKYGELYVRNPDTITGQGFSIFLDMNSSNYKLDKTGQIEEETIEICLSLVKYLLSKSINTEIFINASKEFRFYIESQQNFNDLIDFFMGHKSDGNYEFSEFIYKNLNRIEKLNKLSIIAANADEKIIQIADNIRYKGYDVSLFSCTRDKDGDSQTLGRYCLNNEIFKKS